MSYDQRRSFRFQVTQDRQLATLVMDDRRFSIRVIDESAGGFAIVSPFRLPVVEQQVAELEHAAGRSTVRLSRIEQFPDGQLIGLVRLKDIAVEAPPTPSLFWDVLFLRRNNAIYSRAALGGSLGLVAASFLILFMATEMASWDWRSNASARRPSSRMLGEAMQRTGFVPVYPKRERSAPRVAPKTTTQVVQKTVEKVASSKVPASLAKSLASTGNQVVDLLNNPQVAQQLSLTQDQQQQIESLLEVTADRGANAKDSAVQAIMEILSANQKAQLSQLQIPR